MLLCHGHPRLLSSLIEMIKVHRQLQKSHTCRLTKSKLVQVVEGYWDTVYSEHNQSCSASLHCINFAIGFRHVRCWLHCINMGNKFLPQGTKLRNRIHTAPFWRYLKAKDVAFFLAKVKHEPVRIFDNCIEQKRNAVLNVAHNVR